MTVDEIQKRLLGFATTAEDAADDWRVEGNREMYAECRGQARAFREAAQMLAERTDR